MAKAGRPDAPPAVHGNQFTLKTEDGSLVIVTQDGIEEVDFQDESGNPLGLIAGDISAGASSIGTEELEDGAVTNRKLDRSPIVWGSGAEATDPANIAIGNDAAAVGSGAVAHGDGAVASGMQGLVLGTSAFARARGVAVGHRASGHNDTVTVGPGAVATIPGNVAVGSGADAAGGPDGTAVGHTATTGQAGTAVGATASAGTAGVAVGSGTNALFQAVAAGAGAAASALATAVGAGAAATENNATAVGNGANAAGAEAVAIGAEASAAGNQAVALGHDTHAFEQNTLAAIQGAVASTQDQIVVGRDATGAAGSIDAMALGRQSFAGGVRAVALGPDATASAQNAVAVGHSGQALAVGSIALGQAMVTTSAVAKVAGSALVAGAVSGHAPDSELASGQYVTELDDVADRAITRGFTAAGDVADSSPRANPVGPTASVTTDGTGLPELVLATTSAGSAMVQLATADVRQGTRKRVKNTFGSAGSAIHLVTEGAESVDDGSSYAFGSASGFQAVMVEADGADWWITAERT